jgi:hypothetical protein
MSKELVIYWAPWIMKGGAKAGPDLSGPSEIMFSPPNGLWSELTTQMYNQDVSRNFFQCPAVRDTFLPTYVIYNPLTSSAEVEIKETGEVGRVIQEVGRDSQVRITMPHAPSLTNQLLVCYNLQHIFFAEEPVLMRLTSPWFHKAPHMQYGSLVPGNYDIGRWFRPINFEYNLWDGGTKLEIEAGEPLAYIEFGTDRKIVLKRFEATEKLHTVGGEIIHARSKRWKTLGARYELFDRSPLRKIILKEISENIL